VFGPRDWAGGKRMKCEERKEEKTKRTRKLGKGKEGSVAQI